MKFHPKNTISKVYKCLKKLLFVLKLAIFCWISSHALKHLSLKISGILRIGQNVGHPDLYTVYPQIYSFLNVYATLLFNITLAAHKLRSIINIVYNNKA